MPDFIAWLYFFVRFLKTYQRLVLLLVFVLAAVIISAAYIAINNIVAEQSRIQQQAISPVYNLVNEQLLKPLYIAQSYGQSVDFNNLMDTPDIDQQALIEQLKRMEEKFQLVFFVASEKARKQYFSDGRTLDLVEGEVYWYFEAQALNKDLIADLGQVGDVHLYFDVKIYNKDNENLGFVGVGKRIQEFLDSFEEYKKQYGYDFLFVNDRNEIILSSLPELVVTDEYIPTLETLDWYQLSQQKQQQLDNLLIEVDEESFLISEFAIEELDWRLLLLVPLQARQAQITSSFVANSVLAVSVVLLVFIAGFYLMMRYKQHLEKRIEIDELSGLPNRSYLQRRFNQIRREDSELCIVIVDLDHFKEINDTYGHNAGDIVLQKAAQCLSKELRQQDIVGRWGGEEFVMLIPSSTQEIGEAIAQRAKDGIEKMTFEFNGQSVSVTASFGVVFGSSTLAFSKLLANADLALYEAKRNGRNRVEVFAQGQSASEQPAS